MIQDRNGPIINLDTSDVGLPVEYSYSIKDSFYLKICISFLFFFFFIKWGGGRVAGPPAPPPTRTLPHNLLCSPLCSFSLLSIIRTSSNLPIFKKQLKTFLFRKAINLSEQFCLFSDFEYFNSILVENFSSFFVFKQK